MKSSIMNCLYCVFIIASITCGICATKVSHCDDSPGVFPNVSVTGCAEEPCDAVRGQSVVTNVTFVSPRYLVNITPSVIAIAAGAHVPYFVGSNVCDGLVNTPCPLVENEIATYSFKISVFWFYPKIPLQVVFSIKDTDRNNEEIVCFKVDLQVV